MLQEDYSVYNRRFTVLKQISFINKQEIFTVKKSKYHHTPIIAKPKKQETETKQ